MFDNFGERLYRIFIEKEGYKMVISGLGMTMLLAFFALLIGISLGILLASIKVIKKKNVFISIIHGIVNAYIAFFRGTPIVVQLLLIYFAVLSPLGVNAIVVAILVFGMNSAAYVAEIIRSGILAVDNGQMEAGRSLGLSQGTTMRKIILPQAIKNILPALGNELIVLIKETSVASFITVEDLTKKLSILSSNTYDIMAPYVVLAAIYLVIVLILTFLVNRFERWMRRSDQR